MHLFCCGIPLILSIASISTILGFNSADYFGFEWFEAIEAELFIASGIMLLTTAILHIISRRINCSKNSGCDHKPCDAKKSYAQKIFIAAVVIYSINLVIMLVTNDWHSTTHLH